MDPARAPSTSSFARQTVLIGASGSAWPFVPRKLAGAFFFDYDPQKGSVVWCSGNSSEVLGMTDAACSLHGAFLLAHLHPGDRYRIETSLSVAMQSLQPFVASYRWCRPDSNENRLLHCRAMLDAEAQILRGFILDLSDQLVTLQTECDHLAAISFSFDQLKKIGLVIDVDLRIRSLHGEATHDNFSLGFGHINPPLVRPGALFSSVFTNPNHQDAVQDLLSETICTGYSSRIYGNYSVELRSIAVEGVPQGISIELNDRSTQVSLDKSHAECSSLRHALQEQKHNASKILNYTQEMVGFAALISRQATANPILRHASEALIMTAKDCATDASEILERYQTHQIDVPLHPPSHPSRLMGSAQNIHIRARATEVLVASTTLRSAHTFAALLRDSGLGTIGARLSEPELKEAIQTHPQIRLVVLDLSGDLQHDALLVRRLRRFFPATHIICISREGPAVVERLRRAGAAGILSKPATPREIERAVRQLLT